MSMEAMLSFTGPQDMPGSTEVKVQVIQHITEAMKSRRKHTYLGDASGVLDCPNFISHKGLEGTGALLTPFRFVGISFGIIPLRACSKEEKYDEPKD
jgi:hypothetical protein